MTYKDYFVVEVKENGKILRVKDGSVFLPFGSEYSLLLKNLNSRRASVKVSIDGEDVLDGHSLILHPNTDFELLGYLQGTIAKNKFKFIQKTGQIQEHRGDRIDDGILRVEFAYEQSKPKTILREYHETYYHYNCHPFTTYWTYDISKGPTFESSNRHSLIGDGTRSCCNQFFSSKNENVSNNLSQPLPDEGITVKGEECNQQFYYGSIGKLEEPEVIVINLKGFSVSGKEVKQPLTVKDKITCSTCGTKSKSSFRFCPNCGTFLEN